MRSQWDFLILHGLEVAADDFLALVYFGFGYISGVDNDFPRIRTIQYFQEATATRVLFKAPHLPILRERVRSLYNLRWTMGFWDSTSFGSVDNLGTELFVHYSNR